MLYKLISLVLPSAHYCIQPLPEGVGGGPEHVCVLNTKVSQLTSFWNEMVLLVLETELLISK